MSHGGGGAEGFKDVCIDFTSGSLGNYYKLKNIRKIAQHCLLGAIALVFVGQPFDTVKVKMQTFPTTYTNMMDCFKKTFRSDGIVRGLYAGTTPALIANVAENSVLFAGYGYCQKIIMNLVNKDVRY